MATKTKDQYISPDCEDAGNQSLVPVKVIIPLAAVLTQVVCSNGTSQSRKMEEVLVVYQGEDLAIDFHKAGNVELAHFGQGLALFWARSLFIVQTLPARYRFYTTESPIHRARSPP